MNKFVKILIAAVLAVTLIVVGYFLVYVPYFCNITISIATPMNAKDKYFEDIILSYVHMPKNKIPLAQELTDTHQKFKKDFYEEHGDDSFHIEINITVEKGETVLTYEGTVTDGKTGIQAPYKKDFVYDFVLTKDIQ